MHEGADQVQTVLVDPPQIARFRVTPWRSKKSMIWIATLRPLSRRSRNFAAVQNPSLACAAI
jgi:hypothetical protein